MPIEVSETQTHCGYRVVRAQFVDEVTVGEAHRYHASLLPGAKYEGWGHLIVGEVTQVSLEVREILSSQKPSANNPPPVALVLQSPFARVAAGLALRFAENPNAESFKNEASALRWLDTKMAHFVALRSS